MQTHYPRAAHVLACTTTVATALWLGSLVHLLLTVASLFRAFPKATSSVAVEAAPQIFRVTEWFHLGLAIVAVGAAFWWRRYACTRPRKWVSFLLVPAAMLAIVQLALISPWMAAARLPEDGGGPTFRMLHGVSSMQYLVQTAFVLAAMIKLPAALHRPQDLACAPETTPAARAA